MVYYTKSKYNILTSRPKYAILQMGSSLLDGERSQRREVLRPFSFGVCVARLRGGLAPGRRAMSRVSLRSLAGLKRYAALPARLALAACGCALLAAALGCGLRSGPALSGLRRCGGSAGGRPLRRGRGCPAGSPVAPGCSPLRLRGCCASLRPRSPLRSAAPPLRSFPAAPCVAALAVRSLGGAVAVARRARPAAPPSLRSVARVAAARPARLPAAPCSRLRSRGGAARPCAVPALGRLVGVPPPAFCRAAARGLPLRREKRKPALRPAFRKAVN